MPISEILAFLRDTILALAGVTTAVVAVRGLNSWNRELTGRAGFEAARSLAKATYKLREEIKSLRSPMIWAGEFPEGYEPHLTRKDPQAEGRAYAHIYQKRWEPLQVALSEFDASTLEAEALWGTDVRKKTDELRRCLRSISAAASAVVSDATNGGEDFKTDREFGRRMRATVSAVPGDEKNETSAAVQSAIEGVEALLRPHLRRG